MGIIQSVLTNHLICVDYEYDSEEKDKININTKHWEEIENKINIIITKRWEEIKKDLLKISDYQKNFINEEVEIFVEIYVNQLTNEIGKHVYTDLIKNVYKYINENKIDVHVTYETNYYKIIRGDLIEYME